MQSLWDKSIFFQPFYKRLNCGRFGFHKTVCDKKKHKYKKDAVIHKYEQKFMRIQRGMRGLYPEQCGSGNVGLECASGPGHEYPLSRSLHSPILLAQVLAQPHFTYTGPCTAPLYLSRSLLSPTLLIQVLAWTSHQPMVLEQAWRLAGAIMQSILRSARLGIRPVWPEACSGVPGAIGP